MQSGGKPAPFSAYGIVAVRGGGRFGVRCFGVGDDGEAVGGGDAASIVGGGGDDGGSCTCRADKTIVGDGGHSSVAAAPCHGAVAGIFGHYGRRELQVVARNQRVAALFCIDSDAFHGNVGRSVGTPKTQGVGIGARRRALVIRECGIAAAGSVAQTALYVVDGGKHLIFAGKLPVVHRGVEEGRGIVVREREACLSADGKVDFLARGGIAQHEFAQVEAVAVALRPGIVVVEEVVDGVAVASDVGTCGAVVVVFPRSAGVVFHFFMASGKLHVETDAPQSAYLGRIGDLHVNISVGIYGIVYGDVALRTDVVRDTERGIGLVVAQRRRGHAARRHAGAGVAVRCAGIVVLHPTDVGICRLVDGVCGCQHVDAVAHEGVDETVGADDETDVVAGQGIGAAACGQCECTGGGMCG